jgi:hypothetical protein
VETFSLRCQKKRQHEVAGGKNQTATSGHEALKLPLQKSTIITRQSSIRRWKKLRGLSPDSLGKASQTHRKGAKFAKSKSEARSSWSGATYSGKSKLKFGRMLSDR